MSETVVITARLPSVSAEQLDLLASKLERSRAWVIQRAIETYVKKELDFLEFVQEGIDAADRGDLISQEEMEEWFANRSRRLAAAE